MISRESPTGDAAEEAITPKAADLRRAVADRDRDAVAAILTSLPVGELYALAVVLAHDAGAPKTCRNCGKNRRRRSTREGWEGGRDYCQSCYDRARKAGFPEVLPEALPSGVRRVRADRREQFAWQRDNGWSVSEAAYDVGIDARTAARYEEWRTAGLREAADEEAA